MTDTLGRDSTFPALEEKMRIEDIKFPWEYTDEELEAMPEHIGEHGRCIEYRFEPYHDVKVYEDGYEERYYIGD